MPSLALLLPMVSCHCDSQDMHLFIIKQNRQTHRHARLKQNPALCCCDLDDALPEWCDSCVAGIRGHRDARSRAGLRRCAHAHDLAAEYVDVGCGRAWVVEGTLERNHPPPWPAMPPPQIGCAAAHFHCAYGGGRLRMAANLCALRGIGMVCSLALANPKKDPFVLLVEVKPGQHMHGLGRWAFSHPPKARFINQAFCHSGRQIFRMFKRSWHFKSGRYGQV